MAAIELTPATCNRLQNPDDYPILVSRPIVRVDETEELVDRSICGFTARYRLKIVDGDGVELSVVVPDNAKLGEGSAPPGSSLQAGSILQIDQMLRLPNGREHIILIHSGEIVTEDHELIITDLEKVFRQALHETTFKELLVQKGVSPEMVDNFFALLLQIEEVTREAAASRSPSVGPVGAMSPTQPSQ
ncbi:hypothetical protein BD310DRAFT_851566 [Dichomitus squalens]|uniref:Uncharacterized protein n=1 Tax=Dichomitus squalens TaxID=114155 RepID=A0A4Q9PV73_9APHY|nr:hypothetical protein BD310DRAFT_851566 [Dichomitus squalens]